MFSLIPPPYPQPNPNIFPEAHLILLVFVIVDAKPGTEPVERERKAPDLPRSRLAIRFFTKTAESWVPIMRPPSCRTPNHGFAASDAHTTSTSLRANTH